MSACGKKDNKSLAYIVPRIGPEIKQLVFQALNKYPDKISCVIKFPLHKG
jgi:hypothetical protein